MEHRFVQPLNLLRGAELRQETLILLAKGDLQDPAALVADLNHNVIQQPFLNQVPIHLSGCDRAGGRDQLLHAQPSLKDSNKCRQHL